MCNLNNKLTNSYKMTTKCPVIGDDRIIEALKVADKMATLLKVLADSKESDELVSKWEILKKDCPHFCDK
jgi:hypothetical protein